MSHFAELCYYFENAPLLRHLHAVTSGNHGRGVHRGGAEALDSLSCRFFKFSGDFQGQAPGTPIFF